MSQRGVRMKSIKMLTVGISLSFIFTVPSFAGPSEIRPKVIHRIRGDTNPGVNIKAHRGRFFTSGNGINYNGGLVLNSGVNAYYIWYGNWWRNTATSILTDFISNLGGSPYFNINTTYYDVVNYTSMPVKNLVHYAGGAIDNYSQGTALTDASVEAVVANAITRNIVPKDTNGVYFVLTSADVNETSGFCTQYCGWHTRATIGNADIKYAFVGNPARCPTACEAQSIGPNGNAGADAMASIVAHELEEATTDPDLNAWYDSYGEENADKCAWRFGSYFRLANGSYANMRLGSRYYLIQQNWVNAGGGACALHYP